MAGDGVRVDAESQGAEPDATLAELRDWLAAERPVPYGHWKTTTFVAGLRCLGAGVAPQGCP